MSASKYPKSTLPPDKLCAFLVGEASEMISGGIITQDEFETKRSRQNTKRPDGKEKKQFHDMDQEEKFDFLYTTGQQTQRDSLHNSIRLYGVKKNDARGDAPKDILGRICAEGLKLTRNEVELITSSALRFIQRVEGGKCLVFQLNREDLTRKIFEKIGNLKDFVNPYNSNAKIVFTRNLCPEDNRIRSECLSVKVHSQYRKQVITHLNMFQELLREKGFKDIKVRFNKVLSVNGGPWHEYSWFLEHRYEEADRKEKHVQEQQQLGPSTSGGASSRSYAQAAAKRKASSASEDRDHGDSATSSPNDASGSSKKKHKSRSRDKPKEPRKHSRH